MVETRGPFTGGGRETGRGVGGGGTRPLRRDGRSAPENRESGILGDSGELQDTSRKSDLQEIRSGEGVGLPPTPNPYR